MAMADVRKQVGEARLRKSGLSEEDVARVSAALPATLQGDRDRCIILLGYATALRRSSLAALVREDIDERDDAITIKFDREIGPIHPAPSITVTVNHRPDLCAVTAYKNWIAASGIIDGPLFRWITRHGTLRTDGLSDKAVSMVVKRAVALVGKDPALFAANSLRDGVASLRRAGVDSLRGGAADSESRQARPL